MNISPSNPPLSTSVFSRANLASAFITTASRMVGASYRIYDAYDPRLRKSAVTPEPEVVIKREVISLGMAWVFGLFTAALNTTLCRKLGFKNPNSKLIHFLTIVMANALAEGVSRLISYRDVGNQLINTGNNHLTPPYFGASTQFKQSA